jgi:hypothetical protein
MRFRKAPRRRLAPPQLVPRAPRPWDPPEAELPGIVPINTLLVDRSERTAIAITGIWAYARGFEFFVTRIIRPGTRGWDEDVVPGAPGDRFAATSFQISLQLADGRMVIGGRPYGDFEPAGPILRPRGGGGGSSHCQPPMVGVAAATERAAGIHLSGANARDQRNAGQHRRGTDPRRSPPKHPAMARRRGVSRHAGKTWHGCGCLSSGVTATATATGTTSAAPGHPAAPNDAAATYRARGVSRPEKRKVGASALRWTGRPRRVPEMSPNCHQQPTITASRTRRTRRKRGP